MYVGKQQANYRKYLNPAVGGALGTRRLMQMQKVTSVSYTHLTLPTKA